MISLGTHRFTLQSSLLSSGARLIAALALLASLSAMAWAQAAAARPNLGITPANSYAVSDIENVNLTNGNLNLSIPLASLPPIAGGKLGLTLRANYNSKMWNTARSEVQPDPLDINSRYAISNLQFSGGGWGIGAGYFISFEDAHWDYDWLAPAPNDPEYNLLTQNRWSKMVLHMPDGSSHELRPMDYGSYNDFYNKHNYLRGYYKDDPNTANTALRYYSFDGSYLWAKIDPAQYLYSGVVPSWTLYLPDGTKVSLANGIQRITDTNGNAIKIWSETDGNGVMTTHYQEEIADVNSHREIKYIYNPAGNSGAGLGQVQYQTVGGTWMTTTVNFGFTHVFGKAYYVGDALCGDASNYVDEQIQVIRSIVFPQTETGIAAKQFTFTYNSDTTDTINLQWRSDCNSSYITFTTASHGWGSLKHITMPSGATVDYSYEFDGTHQFTNADDAPRESVWSKALGHDGTTDTWAYAHGPNGGGITESPDGSTVTETMYPYDRAFTQINAGFGGKEGLVYKIENSGKTRVEKHWTLLNFGGDNAAAGSNVLVAFNPVVDAEYTTLLESGVAVKMAAKTFSYDYNGNLLEEKDYDWFDPALVSRDAQGVPTGVPGGATLLRTVTNSYYNLATTANSTNVYARRALANAAPLILNAAQESIVGASDTRFSYDGQVYGTAPTKGNLTRVSRWHDQGSQWLDTVNEYEATYGNLTKTTDPRGKDTTYTYSSTTHAQVTQVTTPDPQNGTGAQTVTMVYDDATGRVMSQTDPNGQTSATDYTNQRLGTVDPFARPGIVTGPAVTSVVGGTSYTNQQRKAKTTYYDDARKVLVETDLNQQGDYKLKSQATADQLGRPILVERSEDGTTNYTISAQTVYDTQNRITLSSNPKRSGAANTDGWTRSTRDVLGRVVEVATFAGATQPPTNTNLTGTVTTSYNANQTTVTDQAGKMRRSVSDALGRLAQVIEDPNSLNYQTNYTYDTLGNLRKVVQGSQNRYFMYDSLSRLIRAKNPEQDANGNLNLTDPITSNSSWAMKYTYDANGNLATRVDARNITTTYTYDSLNRNTGVSYSDSTPAITRAYDTATLGKGKLAQTSTAGGTGTKTTVNSYDALGRPLSQSQQFFIGGAWGSSYTTQQTYNLASGVTSQTYPSGHTTTTNYDAAGRLNTFSGNLGDGTSRNYVTGTTLYTATGQMTEEQFGTTTALYHRQHFDSRGRMYDVLLGTSNVDAGNATINRGRIQNYYSSDYALVNGTANVNGNLYLQKTFVPVDEQINEWVSSSEYYSYDALNRLTNDQALGETYLSATYKQTGPYMQSFSYDRYGNRTIDQVNTWVKDGTVWVEDALPTGATGFADGGDSWNWVTSSPTPYSGTKSSQSNLTTGMHQHYFTGATATMSVSTGDQLYAYIFIDASNVPNEVMLQWHENGSWEHRAYWGANNIAWGTDNTVARRSMGAVPASGRWVRLEVPASLVGLEGKTVDGIAFTLNNGRAWWDRAGKSTLVNGGINNAAYTVAQTNKNQLAPPSGTMHYDAAGNLDTDTFTTTVPGTRNYDAENRMTAVYNNNTVLQDSYYYDGYGQRARRIITGTETWQVYGIGGELVAEYAAGGATNAPQKEYGYRGGQLLIVAESGGAVKWLVTDQLGTPRMVVDKSGDLNGTNGIIRHDYLPFGEEISAGVGIRGTNYGYGADTVRQKFTSQERDNETGLDYFGARYYASVQGRFTSPDPYLGSGKLGNPQSWNRYTYALNNPLRLIDPDGLDSEDINEDEREDTNFDTMEVASDSTNEQQRRRVVVVLFAGGAPSSQGGPNAIENVPPIKGAKLPDPNRDSGAATVDLAFYIASNWDVDVRVAGGNAVNTIAQDIQKTGADVIIYGYSSGALAAVDLTNNLTNSGGSVANLILVDPPSLGTILLNPDSGEVVYQVALSHPEKVSSSVSFIGAIPGTGMGYVAGVKETKSAMVSHLRMDEFTAQEAYSRISTSLQSLGAGRR